MAITRGLLHESKLEEFAAWAEERGWRREPTKGHYEVLRLSKHADGRIIFYQRDRSRHVTIGSDQRRGYALVQRWMRERDG